MIVKSDPYRRPTDDLQAIEIVNTRTRTLLVAILLTLVMVGLTVWLAPDSVDSTQRAVSDGIAPVTALEGKGAPKLEKAGEDDYPPDTTGTGPSVPDAPIAYVAAPREPEPEPEPDYEAQIWADKDLPPALLNLMQSAFVEFYRGNVEYAAMLSQDALEISDDYPAVKPMLYGMIGYSYEKLGYNDMAIEQYRAALEIYPLHRTSYDSMRRLDPEFAASHLKLPAVIPSRK